MPEGLVSGEGFPLGCRQPPSHCADRVERERERKQKALRFFKNKDANPLESGPTVITSFNFCFLFKILIGV